MRKLFSWIILLTWGTIMTTIGLIAALVLIILGHKPTSYRGAILFKVGYNWGGITLGSTIIVCKNDDEGLRSHEFGHVIQNMMFGPLFPFIVAIPSLIRSQYRTYVIDKKIKTYSQLPDYDAIWFEGGATKLGRKYKDLSLKKF